MYNFVTVVDLENITGRNFLEEGAGPQVPMDEANLIWQNEAIEIFQELTELNSDAKGSYRISITSFIKKLFKNGQSVKYEIIR